MTAPVVQWLVVAFLWKGKRGAIEPVSFMAALGPKAAFLAALKRANDEGGMAVPPAAAIGYLFDTRPDGDALRAHVMADRPLSEFSGVTGTVHVEGIPKKWADAIDGRVRL